MKQDYLPHVIILPSYCPVAIALTKDIAEDLARKRGYSNYTIRKATKQDFEVFLEDTNLRVKEKKNV
ncbi:hypothetical protein P7_064 [Pectobacterium phage vB_PcaM_P7_Pc]|nr:hypothetical protein P7_064 [Pectobacterium phage vB_PcaM_P7_Pc]